MEELKSKAIFLKFEDVYDDYVWNMSWIGCKTDKGWEMCTKASGSKMAQKILRCAQGMFGADWKNLV